MIPPSRRNPVREKVPGAANGPLPFSGSSRAGEHETETVKVLRRPNRESRGTRRFRNFYHIGNHSIWMYNFTMSARGFRRSSSFSKRCPTISGGAGTRWPSSFSSASTRTSGANSPATQRNSCARFRSRGSKSSRTTRPTAATCARCRPNSNASHRKAKTKKTAPSPIFRLNSAFTKASGSSPAASASSPAIT